MADELRPCPFCGSPLIPENEMPHCPHGYPLRMVHPPIPMGGDICLLVNASVNLMSPTEVRRWNRRTLPPEVKALVEAVKTERHVRKCRIDDENDSCAAGARYGHAHLADAMLAVDRALAAVEALERE